MLKAEKFRDILCNFQEQTMELMKHGTVIYCVLSLPTAVAVFVRCIQQEISSVVRCIQQEIRCCFQMCTAGN
jgi:hypothetical protein